MKIHWAMLASFSILVCGCDQKGPLPQSAEAAPPQQEAAPSPVEQGPPMVNGVYVVHRACPGEGCTFEFLWRATEEVALRGEAKDAASIVATLAPKESLRAVDSELYVTPTRGVVTADQQGLKAGEIIYLLDYAGEGYYNIWRRGELSDFDISDAKVEWDGAPKKLAPSIWWVRLQRANGQSGWVRDPRNFECMDLHAGDTDCVRAGVAQEPGPN